MASIFVAEGLLFAGAETVAIFFTPIVWSGYILFADAWVFKKRGDSYLVTRRKEFAAMLPVSVMFWLVFEGYNIFLENWRYVGLPDNFWIRLFGYGWSFATIWPAVLETNELLLGYGIFHNLQIRPLGFSNRLLNLFVAVGVVELTVPILFPSPWWGILVWTGFVFLLEPFNYRRGRPSVLAELREGRLQLFLSLMLSGLICGLLWEFWNFWAGAKWIYNVPILSNVKLFEMPVVGYLGFMAFGLEIFAMWQFVRGAVIRK